MNNQPLFDLLSASLASCTANLFTHPFENLKTRQQVGASIPARALLLRVLREEGVASLYRGLNAGLVRAVISGGGRLAIYNQLKLAVLDAEQSGSPLTAIRLSLGMVSGIAAAVVAAPVDLVRTRQVVHHRGPSLSMLGVLQSLVREGGLRGLYQGTSAVFARQAVFTASQLASYDQAKLLIASRCRSDPAAYPTIMMASLLSGVVCTISTAPFEMIKTRMQISKGASLFQTSRLIIEEGGLKAFWRGSFSLYLRYAPHTFIVLVATEQFRHLFGVEQR